MRSWLFLGVLVASACEPTIDTDYLSHLPSGENQRRVLCARGERDNVVTRAMCENGRPDIRSLTDLQRLLGLAFDEQDNGVRTGVALTGHSSSLVARGVNAINPRAILVELAEDRPDNTHVAMGYVRGDQLVEVAVKGPDSDIDFYLFRYEQDCNDLEGGCSNADLLTPATESGWSEWSVYDDKDLNNSVFDCLQCHQPEGPGTPRAFRMQEIQNPWTHWIAAFTDGGAVLLDDYNRAHGPDEVYAGIPARLVRGSNPILVENLVQRARSEQDNLFPSPVIEAEVTSASPGQPGDNREKGRSETWELLYQRAVDGEVIPPPYHDVKITDPGRVESMITAYANHQSGALDELPDIRDVIDEDAAIGMSLRPARGLDGREILVHMCAQCHNGRLDDTLTRARFDPKKLDELSREDKDGVIARLLLPREDRFAMPPSFFRDLSQEEVDAAVKVLRE